MKIRRKRKLNVPLSHSNMTMEENFASMYDPNGSYTGAPFVTPVNPGFGSAGLPSEDVPVQDVDDL